VWVADWAAPQVVRFHTAGPCRPRSVLLPLNNGSAGVWRLAAGAGAIWATTPRDGALWRIDPKTDAVTRIPMPYLPTGGAVPKLKNLGRGILPILTRLGDVAAATDRIR
jgi:hypothetical protein